MGAKKLETTEIINKMYGLSTNSVLSLYGLKTNKSDKKDMKKRDWVKKIAKETSKVCNISKVLTNSREEIANDMTDVFTVSEITVTNKMAGYVVTDLEGTVVFLVAIKFAMCCEAYVRIHPEAKTKYDNNTLLNLLPKTLKSDTKKKFTNL